jgi:hypothetical protein
MSNRTIYTAEFHTDAEWALLEIKAASPEKALKKARAVDPDTLDFEPYGERHPVNYITIRDEDCNDLAEWQAEDLRLLRAAPRMLMKLKKLKAEYDFDVGYGPRIDDELNAIIAEAEGGAS